jgi:hypothetical protein
MLRRLVLILALLLLVGAAGFLWFVDPLHDTVERLTYLHGVDEARLLAELGDPDSRTSFRMDECCSEFRISLYNTYPPEHPGRSSVVIHELIWEHLNHSKVAWLHKQGDKWVVLDGLRFKAGTVF